MAAFTVIDHTELGASATSWEATGISGSYDHLYLVASVRSDRATNYDTAFLQLNGATGSNYSYTSLYSDGGGVLSSRGSSVAFIHCQDITGATNTANTFANVTIWIPNYANTADYKQVLVKTARSTASTARYYWSEALAAGMLTADTAAITGMKLYPSTGPNWVQYSTFTLYGVTGA
jgi:hypothetical protein